MRILIVEDEEHLASGLKFNFEAEGYEVFVAPDGPSALKIFLEKQGTVDLVVLDLMLPGMSGYETCTALRAIDKEVPILVLSARSLSEDRTRAFECGTDQYLTKPFELRELLSRVKNLIERRRLPRPAIPEKDSNIYEFANARIDFRKFEVTVNNQPRKLTPFEMKLLELFVKNEGVVFSRAELLEKVWGLSPAPATRTVDNFMMRLRKHFETDPTQPRHFLSVRGAGYRFVS
ncbi:MAG: response regulator transcription factor [Planctomycetota bacterium]